MSIEAPDLLDELLDVRGRDVLDVGCGEGWIARRLASAGARVVGLDPLAIALERARRAEPGEHPVHYVEGGAEALPFPDASFDVVVFFNSLHHVPEECVDRALAESARVLRPDGLLYVQEPLADGDFFELTRLIEDETRVRDQAQEALGRAADGLFVELARREAAMTIPFADFEALCERLISVEPSRAVAIEEQATALRAAFDRVGRPAGSGREFDQPVRVNLLAPRRPD
jgi:SAM-dependent methyltransferase